MAALWEKIRRTATKIGQDAKQDLACFTPGLAVTHALADLPLRGRALKPVAKWIQNQRDKKILCYLDERYGELIQSIDKSPQPSSDDTAQGSEPIWICWLQGEENAPPLVKKCISSIRRNAGSHPVHLLTEENLSSYVTLPLYILEQYKNGHMKPAHFSDIVRMALLYQNGGLWLDATIFCAKPIPQWYFERDFFSCKGPVRESNYISKYRWTSFVLGGKTGSLFYKLMQAFYFSYWKKERAAVDYLFMDYFIELSCHKLSEIRQMIDTLPENNLQRDDLAACMNQAFSEQKWDALMASDTVLFKLSWREPWTEETADKKKSFYGFFLEREFI